MTRMIFSRIFNKKTVPAVAAVLAAFSFTACKPKISITAGSGDSVKASFTTGFAEETAKVLRAMSGIPEDAPLFAENDVFDILSQVGAEDTSISIPSSTEISSSGTIKNLSGNPLVYCGLLQKTSDSVVLALGPQQFKTFYEILSEEYKAYFDLMMIPSLIDEKMSVSEYESLLSSMYGPTFAKDLVNGTLEILLTSPDGKKVLKESVSLGKILTMTEEKKWELRF